MQSKRRHWNDIYKNNPSEGLSWYQNIPEISLELIDNYSLKNNSSLIDIGCGSSHLVDYLIEKKFKDITLVDLSAEALASVKARLAEKEIEPIYICGDVTKLVFNRKFDLWHDRAVFHFLTQAKERQAYMFSLNKCLATSSTAIIGTFSLNGPLRCSGLEIVQYDEEKMCSVLDKNLQLDKCVNITHVKPDGCHQDFNYFVIKKRKN